MVVNLAESAGQLIISWEHDLVGPPEVFNVERRYATGAVDWSPLTSVPATQETLYSVTDGDDPADGVQYRVNASGAAGTSVWTESAFYVPPVIPSAPINVVVRV